jgi:hypothetical protein
MSTLREPGSYDPEGNVESAFRVEVRDILGLDWSTRDFQILAELRRLKAVDVARV